MNTTEGVQDRREDGGHDPEAVLSRINLFT